MEAVDEMEAEEELWPDAIEKQCLDVFRWRRKVYSNVINKSEAYL